MLKKIVKSVLPYGLVKYLSKKSNEKNSSDLRNKIAAVKEYFSNLDTAPRIRLFFLLQFPP